MDYLNYASGSTTHFGNGRKRHRLSPPPADGSHKYPLIVEDPYVVRSPEDKSSPESDFDKYSNWVTSTTTTTTTSNNNNNKRRRSSSSSSSVVSLLVDELRDLKNLAKDITNEQQKIRKEVNLLATRQTQHSIQLKDFDTQIAQFSEQMSVRQPNSQQHLDNLLYRFPAEHQRPKFQQHEEHQQQQQQQSIVPQNQYLVHSLFTQQQQPQQQDDLHRLLNNNNAPHNKLHENQIMARRRAAKFLPFLSAYNLENYAVPFVLDGPNSNKPFFAVRKVGNLSYRTQLWDAFKTRPVFSFVSPAFSCLVKRSTDELIGMEVKDVIWIEEKTRRAFIPYLVQQTPVPFSEPIPYRAVLRTGDGQLMSVDNLMQIFYDETGETIWAVTALAKISPLGGTPPPQQPLSSPSTSSSSETTQQLHLHHLPQEQQQPLSSPSTSSSSSETTQQLHPQLHHQLHHHLSQEQQQQTIIIITTNFIFIHPWIRC